MRNYLVTLALGVHCRSPGLQFLIPQGKKALTDAWQRCAYGEQDRRVLKPGGSLIVSTFGPSGPERCSGLLTTRYDASSLGGELGDRFSLVESSLELHATPSRADQQFLFLLVPIS